MGVQLKQFTSGVHEGGASLNDDATGRDLITVSKFGFTPNYRNKVVLFDDFLGDVIEDGWSAAKGADPQGVIATIQAGVSGLVRLTSGDVGDTFANDGSSLTHELNWKANQGNLVAEFKFTPVSSVASVAYFIGLSDAKATGTLEAPFTLSGTTFTSNATDAVGFVFDTAATTDTWRCVGVKADTDATAVDTSLAPVADTAAFFRVEVDSAGNATFYINDAKFGPIANAVTATVALTPIVTVVTRTTATKSVDVDYVYVSADRA